jgi:predicted metal-binding membrane protein
MQWEALSRLVPLLIGATLVVSGVMQFSRWKMAALNRCRDPLACAARHAVGGRQTAWRQGLNQGMSCAICCAGPMLALLALGAMNPAMMVIVALVIAMEKLAPNPCLVVRLAGAAALVAGVAVILRPTLLQ